MFPAIVSGIVTGNTPVCSSGEASCIGFGIPGNADREASCTGFGMPGMPIGKPDALGLACPACGS